MKKVLAKNLRLSGIIVSGLAAIVMVWKHDWCGATVALANLCAIAV